MCDSQRAICVTLNAAIDRTYYSEQLQLASVNRVKRVVSQAGGKGNNVARAIHRLGGSVAVTGFVGGQNGHFIQEALFREGIFHEFCEVSQGESRVCLTVVDTTRGTATEIIEPGIHVSQTDIERLHNQLEKTVVPGMIVVYSGSLPPGVGVNEFITLINFTKSLGARVIVDTSGEALTHAAQCSPFSVKPNEHEVAALLDNNTPSSPIRQDASGYDELRAKIIQLYQAGIELPIVTLGANGAIACHHNTIFRVQTPKVEAVNTVGSGDSFLGGIVYALINGMEVQEALAIGSAAGAVNAMKESAGLIDREEVMSLAGGVRVTTEAW